MDRGGAVNQLDMLNPETEICAGCGDDTRIALTDARGWNWCQRCLNSGEQPWEAEDVEDDRPV